MKSLERLTSLLRSCFLVAVLTGLCSCAQRGFTGMRVDDLPLGDVLLNTFHDKNATVGIADIETVVPGAEETLIRVNSGFGLQPLRRDWIGGHPLVFWQLRVVGAEFELYQHGPCRGEPDFARSDPQQLWQVMQQQQFFAIRDSRSVPGYPSVRDGILHVIQIRSATTYRAFMVSNPDSFDSADNRRLQSVLRTAADLPGPSSCYDLPPGLLPEYQII